MAERWGRIVVEVSLIQETVIRVASFQDCHCANTTKAQAAACCNVDYRARAEYCAFSRAKLVVFIGTRLVLMPRSGGDGDKKVRLARTRPRRNPFTFKRDPGRSNSASIRSHRQRESISFAFSRLDLFRIELASRNGTRLLH